MSENELSHADKVKIAKDRVEDLLKDVDFKGIIPNKKNIYVELLNRVPMFVSASQSITGTGISVLKLLEIGRPINPALKISSQNFQIAGVAIALIDFLRIPVTYLLSFLLEGKVTFKPSKNIKLLYASVILGLGLSALLLPALAPFMIGSTATLSFIMSSATLLKYTHAHFSSKKRLTTVRANIETEKNNFQTKCLNLANKVELLDKAPEAEQIALLGEIDTLTREYPGLKDSLLKLYNEEATLLKKINKTKGMRMVDKIIGAIISTIVVGGIATAAFNPLIGISIVTGAAALGASYILFRGITSLVIYFLSKWNSETVLKDEEGEVIEEDPESEPTSSPHLMASLLGNRGISTIDNNPTPPANFPHPFNSNNTSENSPPPHTNNTKPIKPI